jgi:hypothetical protein
MFILRGRSFARQNSLTLWAFFSDSADHSERSAGVQLTLVIDFVAAGTATFIASFVSGRGSTFLQRRGRCGSGAEGDLG